MEPILKTVADLSNDRQSEQQGEGQLKKKKKKIFSRPNNIWLVVIWVNGPGQIADPVNSSTKFLN